MRWLPKVLLAVGLVASVDDEPATNDLQPTAELPAGVLDDQTPALRYLVHIELQKPVDSESGELTPYVTIQSRIDPSAIYYVTLEFKSLTDPDHYTTIGQANVNPTAQVAATGPQTTWGMCSTDPCVEDYELTIRRPAAPGLVVDLGGHVDLTTYGASQATPQTAQAITIMGPMP